MTSFDEQLEKGKQWEQHFFKHLDEQKQMPKYNNFGGNNKEFDIEANGKKYEIKSDYKENQTLPIEIFHWYTESNRLTFGWLFTTESDYIIFYKTHFQERIYLHSQNLFDFVQTLLPKRRIIPTYDKEKITYNMPIEMNELGEKNIIKRIEPYLLH